MTAHEVLCRARNLIDREGHIKGRLADPGRGVCARGGVFVACGVMTRDGAWTWENDDSPMSRIHAEIALAEAIGDQAPLPYTISQRAKAIERFGEKGNRWADAAERIVPWNNAEDRTKEEVLAAFDKAIAQTAPPPADPFTSTDNLPEFRVRELV